MRAVPRSVVPLLLPPLSFKQAPRVSALEQLAVERPWAQDAQQSVIDNCMETARFIVVPHAEPPIEVAEPLESMVRLRQLYATLHPPEDELAIASNCPDEVRTLLSVVRLPRRLGGGCAVVPVEADSASAQLALAGGTAGTGAAGRGVSVAPIAMARGPLSPMVAASESRHHVQLGRAAPHPSQSAGMVIASGAEDGAAYTRATRDEHARQQSLSELRRKQREAEVRFGIAHVGGE